MVWSDLPNIVFFSFLLGFEAMGEARYTSDVNWGCMIRSSQMLVAQVTVYNLALNN